MHRPIARSEKEKQSTMHLSHLPTYFSPTLHLFHSHICSASPCNPLIIPARSLLATSSTFLSPTPSPHPSSCHLPRAYSSAAPAALLACLPSWHVMTGCLAMPAIVADCLVLVGCHTRQPDATQHTVHRSRLCLRCGVTCSSHGFANQSEQEPNSS